MSALFAPDGSGGPRAGGAFPHAPSLLLWPEHSYHELNFFELDDEPTALRPGRSGKPNPELERVVAIARHFGVAIALGACRYPPTSREPMYHNSIVYFNTRGEYAGCYDKTRLVPGFEFQPILGRLVTALSGEPFIHPENIGNLVYHPGRNLSIFRLEPTGQGSRCSFACCICYDISFPDLFRAYLNPPAGRPRPDFFVAVANESITSGTALQALTDARFRAIEGRRSFVRNCCAGYSALVDSCGRIRWVEHGLEKSEKIICVDVPIDSRRTVYFAVGDVLPLTTTILLVSYLAYAAVHRRASGRMRGPDETRRPMRMVATLASLEDVRPARDACGPE